MACAAGVIERSRADNDFPVTNCAMARRSAAELRLAIEIIAPLSSAASTRSADIVCSASRPGARSTPASWHAAQFCLYRVAPSSACAEADRAESVKDAQNRMGKSVRQAARGLWRGMRAILQHVSLKI